MTIAHDELDALVNEFGSNDQIVCQECQDTMDIDNMSVSDLDTMIDVTWATDPVLNILHDIVEFERTDASRHTFDYPFTYSKEMMNSIMAEHDARTKTKLEEFDREFNAESDTYCGLEFNWATGVWA